MAADGTYPASPINTGRHRATRAEVQHRRAALYEIELAPRAEIHFERIAVNPDQIKELNLPTRPTKQTDSRAKRFGEISVELDAIEPSLLRALVQVAIEDHLPPEQLRVLKVAEQSERAALLNMVAGLGGDRP
jgi:hypothetical protein